jgi:septal ring factor EnvC (AmiA/AmiB activator)
MKNLYDIIEMCVIFFLLVIIFLYVKKKFNLVETFTKRDLDSCRKNNGSIKNAIKEQSGLKKQLKNTISELKSTTNNLKNDSKRINNLMKAAKKKADKTGANPNAVKD